MKNEFETPTFWREIIFPYSIIYLLFWLLVACLQPCPPTSDARLDG
jgi:hypothetical protein